MFLEIIKFQTPKHPPVVVAFGLASTIVVVVVSVEVCGGTLYCANMLQLVCCDISCSSKFRLCKHNVFNDNAGVKLFVSLRLSLI